MSEFLPEGEVVVSEALPVLGQLSALLFIVGCIYVLDGFTRALFGSVSGAVGWIPWLGHVATKPIHKIEQKITAALGRAERGFDKRLGTSWHKLGQVARHLARELEGQALALWAIAGALASLVSFDQLMRLWRKFAAPIHAKQATHTKQLAQAKAGAQAVGHELGHVVRPQLRTLESEMAHVIEWDLPRLRARDRALAREYDRLHKWLRARPWDVPTKAFVGAVAVALALMGGSWIRCRNWRRIGNHVCHLPVHVVEELLGLTVAALALRDLCRLVGVIEGIAVRVQPAIEALVLELEGFMCGGTAALPSGTVQSDLQRVAAMPSGIIDSDLRPPSSFAGF